MGNMEKQVNSMTIGPYMYFLCYEVNYLIRNNPVWNTVVVVKAFSKSTDGRSIACWEETTITRMSVPVRTKFCLFHDGSNPM